MKNTKTGHTPGKWEVCGPCIQQKNDPIFYHAGVKRGGVRTATAVGIGEDEARANAALISAAPDLLLALENILEAFVHVPGDIKGNKARTIAARIIGSPNAALARAREAIDKAEAK